MPSNRLLLFIICFSLGSNLIAQEISGGFRAGLNLSIIDGEAETNNNGDELEEFKYTQGFHIGGAVNFKFSDLWGLRAEVLYNQKGLEYRYEGPSYWIFPTVNDGEMISTGTRQTELQITNGYIDIPLMAYIRFSRVELEGGVQVAFLVASRGFGEITYNGFTPNGIPIGPFTADLDYNYFSDQTGRNDLPDVETRLVGGTIIEVPTTVGAFYEREREDQLFNIVDVGLNAGLRFYINKGLFLGFRFNYGLLDVTNDEQDISAQILDAQGMPILRDDFDRNITLSASIGFSF